MSKWRAIFTDPDLVYAAVVVVIWRIIVEGYAVFALNWLTLSDQLQHKFYPLTVWTNWDAGHFMILATQGYFTAIQYAFFPLLPLTMHLLAWPAVAFFGIKITSYILAGLLINTAALIGAGYYLLKLSRLDGEVGDGRRALLLLLFSPAAIFLAAIYSEPYFLLWITGAFYFAKTKQWWWAGIFGMAAALTRQVGFLLVVPLLIEFWIAYGSTAARHWQSAIAISLTPLGLVLYMIYEYWRVGNPLEFAAVESTWQRQFSLQAPVAVFNQIITALDLRHFQPKLTSPFYDALATLVFVGLTTLLTWRRYFSYAALMVLLILAPLASGQVYGMIRYTLVLFPGFLLLGQLTRRPTVFGLTLAALAMFFALLSINFLNGWWVA